MDSIPKIEHLVVDKGSRPPRAVPIKAVITPTTGANVPNRAVAPCWEEFGESNLEGQGLG